ncbi:MAG: twin-arginine translocase TatA/TatE family subunit [Acidobacteria bacterium]|nr:twin-arginine translocase TatA/TatE family subunit [Bacteroidota bacterium]MCZ6507747.1 twin-arginine translocase TatA/TatE family subunit [Acidobacteriota bacterium]MCZ6727059.1 twin-arginine translocase TatA/TatE family subunit [Acidobacteriota bacterium]
MSFGFQELLVIFLIVLVLFGAAKLPQLGRGLGEGIKNFRKSIKGSDSGEGSDDDA